MSQLNVDFSFRKDISSIKKCSRSEYSCSLPKQFANSNNFLTHTGTYLNASEVTLNNTSRFQQKKVLRKLKEQDVLNRIELKLKKMNENDHLLKQSFKFRPVKSKKHRREKENLD